MLTLDSVLRGKFHLNSAHPELHKTLYVLCVTPMVAGLNAAVFYLRHGSITWPTPADTSAPWASDTYAFAWLSLASSLVATVLFVMFVRHRRVSSSSKIVTATVLSMAWLFTLMSFLVID